MKERKTWKEGRKGGRKGGREGRKGANLWPKENSLMIRKSMVPHHLSLKTNEVKADLKDKDLCEEKTVGTVKGFPNDTKTRNHSWQEHV